MNVYPENTDCVWLASDRDGHLGAFITAGVGPIPVEVLGSSSIPVEEIEGQLCQLPVVSQAQLLVSVPRPDDFLALAERGVFVYDWTDINRTGREEQHVYEPVAVPTEPITVSGLPTELAAVAKVVKISNVLFAAGKSINIRNYFSCVATEY